MFTNCSKKKKGYFNKLLPREWSVDGFDAAYTERAKINKFISHSHFSSDLNTLQDSFPDDHDIINHITKLRRELQVGAVSSRGLRRIYSNYYILLSCNRRRVTKKARIIYFGFRRI